MQRQEHTKKTLTTKQHLSLLLLCFLIGIGYQMTAASITQAANANNDDQNKNLIELITKLDSETSALEQEIAQVREGITNSQVTYGKDAAAVIKLREELETLQFLVGQTKVTGPGLVLTVNDNTSGAAAARQIDPENFVAENYIIHDTDLRYLLNDIAYLAEGVAINDQRITSLSDIRCVGTVIMVNSTRLAPPYELKFIGPIKMLEAAIEDSAQYQYLASRGMPLKISSSDPLELPAYSGSLPYDQIKPYSVPAAPAAPAAQNPAATDQEPNEYTIN